MFYRFTAYIVFLLKSTNQHGVHSPFVFNFVTKCLYNKTNDIPYTFRSSGKLKQDFSFKQHKLIFKLIRYFNIKSVVLFNAPTNNNLLQTIALANPNTLTHTKVTTQNVSDFIFVIDICSFQIEKLDTLLKHCHNDSIILFKDIYLSKNTYSVWKTIQNHPRVRVTINTFHFGFVFIRKEQVKQHFWVRL